MSWPKQIKQNIHIPKELPEQYAKISGDVNPVHLDDQFAKSFGLKGRILHGLCTLGLIEYVLFPKIPKDHFLKTLKLRFSEPVYPLDQLSFNASLNKSASEIHYDVQCENQNQATVLSHTQLIFTHEDQSKEIQPKRTQLNIDWHKEETSWEAQQLKPLGDFFTNLTKNKHNSNITHSVLGILTLMPFFGQLMPSKEHNEPQKKVLIHANQTFNFYKPLALNQKVYLQAGIERKVEKYQKEFIYFLTQAFSTENNLLIQGRSLLVRSVI